MQTDLPTTCEMPIQNIEESNSLITQAKIADDQIADTSTSAISIDRCVLPQGSFADGNIYYETQLMHVSQYVEVIDDEDRNGRTEEERLQFMRSLGLQRPLRKSQRIQKKLNEVKKKNEQKTGKKTSYAELFQEMANNWPNMVFKARCVCVFKS